MEESHLQFKQRFLREIRNARWTQTELQSNSMNFEPAYLKRVSRASNVFQTMPPSPGSRRMYIKAELTQDDAKRPVLETIVSHDLWDETKDLIKRTPESQLVRRGRAMTTFYRPLQHYEITKRTTNATLNMDKLKEV